MATSEQSPLPLTTRFNPPSSCLNTSPTLFVSLATGTGYRYHQGPTDAAGCFPPGWNPTSYFSPGLCPHSYTIAHKSEVSIGTLTETHAICCAGGLTVDPAKQTLPWEKQEPCASQIARTATQADGNVIDRAYYNGYGVSIRWQASDMTPATATAGPITSAPAAAQVQQTPSGLSTGAKVGIGVGAGVGGLLLIVAALGLFWLRRKRDKPEAAGQQMENYQGPSTRDISSQQDFRDMSSQQDFRDIPSQQGFRDIPSQHEYPDAPSRQDYRDIPSRQDYRDSPPYYKEPSERSYPLGPASDTHSRSATRSQAFSLNQSLDARSATYSPNHTPDYANSWNRNTNSPAELDTHQPAPQQTWI
ncbi:hypothetical protein N7492_000503 [Penicillium capsulatum]|uniref:Uncharacterized protein n=1 Tax=Penicillium capsulatum TaxID=69766 RepID=A0A9W9M064_9EURO|nr:hypothetical protein N7492_000503 [Penicillium capsulatum]KAJ6130439.1 hypothetical protein N7512_003219 [Penicillium capsulatum]